MTTPEKKSALLVKAPKGKGFFLTLQDVYVSSRPHVVEDNSQVQIAENRKCITILGKTAMTDEDFAEAYSEDPAAAIEAALAKDTEADPDTVEAAKAAAAKEKEESAKREKDEAARLVAEEEKRVAEAAKHQKQLKDAKKG